jgi:HTH-type transcriptional regulator/antitoxin HigA
MENGLLKITIKVKKMSPLLQETVNYWPFVANVLSVSQTEADYHRTVTLLDELIDTIGDDENNPLASLMDTLSLLIEAYEMEHYPMSEVSVKEVLQSIIEEHDLTVNDFPELGSPITVSEILNGERQLNKQQVDALSKRFRVSPSVFL